MHVYVQSYCHAVASTVTKKPSWDCCRRTSKEIDCAGKFEESNSEAPNTALTMGPLNGLHTQLLRLQQQGDWWAFALLYLLLIVLWYWIRRCRHDADIAMPVHVAELWVYPIKSCAGSGQVATCKILIRIVVSVREIGVTQRGGYLD